MFFILFFLLQSVFFPLIGERANDLNFKAYLVTGLARWNTNCAYIATNSGSAIPKTYSGIKQDAIKALSKQLVGKKIYPQFSPQHVHWRAHQSRVITPNSSKNYYFEMRTKTYMEEQQKMNYRKISNMELVWKTKLCQMHI